MKRIALILGVVAVMAAMVEALTAPAMAKDNDGNGNNNRQHNSNNGNNHNGNNGGNNHFDNQLNRIDNRVDNWFDNHHDNWFDNDRDNVTIRYVSDSDGFDSDDFDSYFPYWGSYGDCGFDWDGPVTPADCWD
jgi:hypothetical protein